MEKYLPENFARWDLRKLQRKKQKERENKQTKEKDIQAQFAVFQLLVLHAR